jgi:hypothetical protein
MKEMSRVTVPGGTIAAYVWDYAGRMELIRRFWDVASSLDPAASLLHEGTRFPICQPDALRAAFADAGLNDVEVSALDTVAVFTDFDDYWQPFLGGQGPAPAYTMSLDEDPRARLRDALRISLPHDASGTISTRAWAVRGTRSTHREEDVMSDEFVVVFAIYPRVTQLDFTGPHEVPVADAGRTLHPRVVPGGDVEADGGIVFTNVQRIADIERCDLICVPGGFGTIEAMEGPRAADASATLGVGRSP